MSSHQLSLLDEISAGPIRSHPCPACYLCGKRGELLYEGLTDRLFGVPGGWNLMRCPELACGLLWLDPMPTEEDIGKAYFEYYTHVGIRQEKYGWRKDGRLMQILRLLHDLLLAVTLISRERRRLALMYLDEMPSGRVLDVGCGDGSRLARLQSLGWDVRGQEMDPKAASQAEQAYGVKVHLGPLEEAGFHEGEFDAIVMNHVLEHVHDPIRLLTKCVRLLKKGGTLIAVTPNTESCGHKRFGRSWRGLEPPRHVHLFSQRTLQQLARGVGFGQFDTWTTPAHAEGVACGSLDILAGREEPVEIGRKLMRRLWSLQYQLRWQLAYVRHADSGEECVLKAVR